jgi:hypothetical protein
MDKQLTSRAPVVIGRTLSVVPRTSEPDPRSAAPCGAPTAGATTSS